jgi:uncharacterized protein
MKLSLLRNLLVPIRPGCRQTALPLPNKVCDPGGYMKRRDLVLAAMSRADGTGKFTPVQVQKLFFLVDRNLAEDLGGALYNFRPYDYGPFDSQVYSDLETLATDGLVEIEHTYRWRVYRLTPEGREAGESAFAELSSRVQNYLDKAVVFVRGLSFSRLVSAIYKAYPDMRTNSVFRG